MITSSEKAEIDTEVPNVAPSTGQDKTDVESNSPETRKLPAITVPGGGLVAWIQVAVGFMLMFSTWGLVTSFGVFQTYYEQSPVLSTPSSISWIGSVQPCLLMFFGALSGHLMDAGHARLMSIVGSFLVVLGICCSSISGGNKILQDSSKEKLVYWQIFLGQGVCTGIGMGLISLPSVGVPAMYFTKKRAFAVGIVTSGASVGGILYPIIFQQVLAQVGFRWACRVVALVALITLASACAMMKPRTDLPRKAKGPLVEFTAMREPTFLALGLGMALSFTGVYILYYYITPGATAAGVHVQYLVILLNVGGFYGRILPGSLFLHAGVAIITGILLFIWLFVLNKAGLIVLALVYGFFSGGFTSLPPSSVASVSPDMSRFGARLGFAVTLIGFDVLARPPIAGAIIKFEVGYVRAGIFGGVVTVIGGLEIAVAAIRNRKYGRE